MGPDGGKGAQLSLISICCRAITAWVRFLTPSLRKMAVIWALMVASETLSSPGDLLVEAAVPQHDQHLVLLGSEAGQLAGKSGRRRRARDGGRPLLAPSCPRSPY